VRRVAFDHNDAFARPLVEGQARITRDMLAEGGKTPATLANIVDEAHAFADEAAEEASARVQEAAAWIPACKAGCAHCCYGTPVFASAPEVVRIAEHLRATRDQEALARLRVAIADTATRLAPLSQEARQKLDLPCPLLDVASGRCAVYEVRPFACRAYNSCDVGACESARARGEANPILPTNILLFRARHAVGFGMMAGFTDAGLDVGPYELASALAQALAVDDVGRAFVDGAIAFTHTAVSEEAREGYDATMRELAGDLAGGGMRTLDKHLERMDPEARRKARNKRKRDRRR
jgi:Fe-S-cluster containining protein